MIERDTDDRTLAKPPSPRADPVGAAADREEPARISKRVVAHDATDRDPPLAAYGEVIDHALATRFTTAATDYLFRSAHVGPIRILELTAAPRRSERTASQIAIDRYEGISAQLVIAGSARGEAAGRKVISLPGTLMLLDFGQPFVIVDDEPRTVINASIPRSLLSPYVADCRTLHGRVIDAEQGALLIGYLTTLTPRLEQLATTVTDRLATVLVNLLLVALGLDPTSPEQPTSAQNSLFTRACQLIDGRLGAADLSPEWLVARLNISRSELYAAFKDVGGIARYIWQRRLEAASVALRNPAETRRIRQIAFHYGFTSEAHFSRAFKSAFGVTPTEVKRPAAD